MEGDEAEVPEEEEEQTQELDHMTILSLAPLFILHKYCDFVQITSTIKYMNTNLIIGVCISQFRHCQVGTLAASYLVKQLIGKQLIGNDKLNVYGISQC